MAPCGVGHRLRVVHGDPGPEPVQSLSDVQRGGVPDVVGVRFEGSAQDGDPGAVDESSALGDGQSHHPVTAAEVDSVDLAEQPARVPDVELVRPSHQRPDVLGEATAAEPEAGGEELGADAWVVTKGVREAQDVASRGLAEVRHRVDEGDLGRQERVRCNLDQLSRRRIGDHHRCAPGQQRVVHLTQSCLRVGGADPEHQPVGSERVRDRLALAQELRIPRDLHPQVRCPPLDHRLQPGRGADGDGRLADHECA